MSTKEVRKIVAKNLQHLMRKRRCTPNRLATDAGLSYSAVNDIMNGRSKNPRIDTLQKVSDVLGVPLIGLFLTPEDADVREELLLWFDRMGADQQRQIADLARARASAQPAQRSRATGPAQDPPS